MRRGGGGTTDERVNVTSMKIIKTKECLRHDFIYIEFKISKLGIHQRHKTFRKTRKTITTKISDFFFLIFSRARNVLC